MNYTQDNGIGETMTRTDWLECVALAMFIDYDGYGHPSDGTRHDPTVVVHPSNPSALGDATHIEWYNR